jgi:tetrahydromethanopterin S-methyltransferase subunit G
MNQTNVDMAANYVSKVDFHVDFARMMTRLDTLDAKLDRIIENYRQKGDA